MYFQVNIWRPASQRAIFNLALIIVSQIIRCHIGVRIICV